MKTFPAMPSLRFVLRGTTYSGSGPMRRVSPIKMYLRAVYKDARVLLTFDKDFGELAWRSGLPASCGIYYSACRRSVPQVSARPLPMF
jgi:hypothetical protein